LFSHVQLSSIKTALHGLGFVVEQHEFVPRRLALGVMLRNTEAEHQ
jgi:hypothetical protein